jgi:hypothetical protein
MRCNVVAPLLPPAFRLPVFFAPPSLFALLRATDADHSDLDVGTQLSSNDELLDLLVKVLEFWRKKQGVVTRRRHVTQMNISPVDLALCIVTTVQLARHAIVRRKLAQRAIAVLLNEVALALAKAL